MNFLICHERFVFRFGADRVLLLLPKGLRALGHHVTFAGNRYDRGVTGVFGDRLIEVPGDLGPCLDLNELTADWLKDSWRRLFAGVPVPDVAIVGGAIYCGDSFHPQRLPSRHLH